MSVVEEIRASNQAYVNSWTKGQLPLPPARKIAIVTVSDFVFVDNDLFFLSLFPSI